MTRLPRSTSGGGGRGHAWGENIGALFRSFSPTTGLGGGEGGGGDGEEEMKPRSIVVDSQQGVVFWTNMLLKPRIERANLDGTNRFTIKLSSLGEVFDITVGHCTLPLVKNRGRSFCQAFNSSMRVATYVSCFAQANRKCLHWTAIPRQLAKSLRGGSTGLTPNSSTWNPGNLVSRI